jgi:quinol-cytochrome oxidoreductase complex cytochrome b subunit
MRSFSALKKIAKDKKAVFGLTSVQQFFAIILGVALLAYVIVVIMGTLQTSSILPTASLASNQTNAILANVSTGITSFFGAINPVYAILAILVIILVLVVLVRVVSGSTSSGGTPQL